MFIEFIWKIWLHQTTTELQKNRVVLNKRTIKEQYGDYGNDTQLTSQARRGYCPTYACSTSSIQLSNLPSPPPTWCWFQRRLLLFQTLTLQDGSWRIFQIWITIRNRSTRLQMFLFQLRQWTQWLGCKRCNGSLSPFMR